MRRETTLASARGWLAAVLFWVLAVSSAAAGTVRYHPRHEDLTYTFGGNRPVLTLRPGDILETWTEDCFDGRVKKPEDLPSSVVPPGHDNPQTGPFAVEGAAPGDTLAIRILDLRPARDYAVSSAFPGFGALTATDLTALLHPPLPEKVWFYAVDRQHGTARFRPLSGGADAILALAPFLGCIGVAPTLGEVRSTIVPGDFGGNLDTPEVRRGALIMLPVNVPGAMLSVGDGHLLQGEGEIIGTAIESALEVKLRVDLVKGKSLRWPRIENDEEIMTVGSARPLEDALRIASREMVRWLSTEEGFEEMDAYQLLSQAGRVTVSQAVDPNYTVVSHFPRKLLPSKARR